MNVTSRHVALWLYGFNADPYEVMAAFLGVQFFAKRRGEGPNVRNRPGPLLVIKHEFNNRKYWGDAVKELIELLGGVENLDRLLKSISATEQNIDFLIPVRGSPLQENNFVAADTIGLLARLNLGLGFDFPHFDPSDPTHVADEDRELLQDDD